MPLMPLPGHLYLILGRVVKCVRVDEQNLYHFEWAEGNGCEAVSGGFLAELVTQGHVRQAD